MFRSLRWFFEIFSMELKRLLSYRADFWLQFLGPLFLQLGIAYFLWSSIFQFQSIDRLNGFSLPMLMSYYLLVALGDKAISGWFGWDDSIGADIYDGNLSKYLVFPIPYFVYKIIRALAGLCFSFLQLLLSLGVYVLFFELPMEYHVNVASLALGFCALLVAMVLFFLMSSILDLVAFWAETVWSLQVMLRFSMNLCGGALIPIAFFPKWSQEVLPYLPFYYLVNVPVKVILGEIHLLEFVQGLSVCAIWILIFSFVLNAVWRKGLRGYTGVGM